MHGICIEILDWGELRSRAVACLCLGWIATRDPCGARGAVVGHVADRMVCSVSRETAGLASDALEVLMRLQHLLGSSPF